MYLRSLIIIDVQGNMGWKPEENQLFELPRLKEIRNVSWAAECADCWLIKKVSEDALEIYNKSYFTSTSAKQCIIHHYTFSDYLTMLARHRFVVKECRNVTDCILRKEANVTNTYLCWRLNQRVVSGQLLLGTLGAVLNMVVFFNILLTRSLRKNVSMVFLCNLALGDTLICVFLVLMASMIVSYRYQDFENILESLCPRVGFLWVLGQCATSITSVALTVERYLCIVFSMKPDIRVTPRLASLAVAVNWVFAALFMSVALYFNIYRLNYLCIPMIYDMRFPIATHYSIALGSIALTLYLVTIPLYVHIYKVVKQSSEQMGIQRESTLAKRIAILVGTNLVLFFLPILSLGAWKLLVNSSHQMQQSIYFRRAISDWIPQYCLTINSCLNPLVHAFRNDKFKNALKQKLPLRCNTSKVTPATQKNSDSIPTYKLQKRHSAGGSST